MKSLINLVGINKYYGNEHNRLHVLKDFTLSIDSGEMVAIVGKSGSGKSTLLNIIGGIDKPDSGEYYYKGNRIDTLNQKEMTIFRGKNIGFIVQHFALINDLKVFDNIALPTRYNKKFANKAQDNIYYLLENLGLKGKEKMYPSHLSGGEAQRVAVARALVCNPELLLADEPTGSLDDENQQIILDIFKEINKLGVTILIVTHDYDIAKFCDRTIQISEGKVNNMA